MGTPPTQDEVNCIKAIEKIDTFKLQKIETPLVINHDNALTKETKTSLKYQFGRTKMKSLFLPTKNNMYHFCFNLSENLAAFILQMLLYYRDNNFGYSGFIPYPENIEEMTQEELDEFEERDKMAINYVISGFWVGANTDELQRTPQQQKNWDEARKLLAEHWEGLWI